MSRDARRVPAGRAVDVMQYPPATGASGPAVAVRPAALPQVPGGRLTGAPHREPLQPIAFAERVAAAERAAFARGVADGERAASMSVSSRVDVMVARFAASIEHVAASRLAMLHGTERDLVRAAIAMAEHVLRRKVEVDPALLVSMAREALERLGGAPAVTIHVNPADFETIARLQPSTAIRGAVEVVADPNVHPGGCLARTAGGTIDAGIDAQFRELTRAMLGEGPRVLRSEGQAGPGQAGPGSEHHDDRGDEA